MGERLGARLNVHGTHISPSAQPSGTLRGLQTHRETEVGQTDRTARDRPRARARRRLTSWSSDGPGLGGHCGQAALTGLLGRQGPFYLAGPRESPTQRARRRPRRPRPGKPWTRQAPRPVAHSLCAPSPDAGKGGRVPAGIRRRVRCSTGKSRGREVAGGQEGGGAVFCRGNWRAAAGGTVGGSESP